MPKPQTAPQPLGFPVELDRDDFDLLLLAVGMATGIAIKNGDRRMANCLMRFANHVNRHNLNWVPYEVDGDGEGEN
jgi:hypothetical protein